MIMLNVYKLRDDFELPTYGTSLSNCFDLSFQPSSLSVKGYNQWNETVEYPCLDGKVAIYPGDRMLIPTGLIIKLEQALTVENFTDLVPLKKLARYSIRLHPRSGLSLKRGLVLANSEGIVDVDYQEQVFVLLTNISRIVQTISVGERIAQAEVVCNEDFEMIAVKDHPVRHSERTAGFGSTGV